MLVTFITGQTQWWLGQVGAGGRLWSLHLPPGYCSCFLSKDRHQLRAANSMSVSKGEVQGLHTWINRLCMFRCTISGRAPCKYQLFPKCIVSVCEAQWRSLCSANVFVSGGLCYWVEDYRAVHPNFNLLHTRKGRMCPRLLNCLLKEKITGST